MPLGERQYPVRGRTQCSWGKYFITAETTDEKEWKLAILDGDVVVYEATVQADAMDIPDLVAKQLHARHMWAFVGGKERDLADFLVFERAGS